MEGLLPLSSLSSLSAVAFFLGERRLGEQRRPSPATSTHQVCPPLLFRSRCAKRSTPNPNISNLYSDLPTLQADLVFWFRGIDLAARGAIC